MFESSGPRYVTSVCTGSLVLGAAGLLRGKRAACHWASRDMLALFGAIPDAGRVVRDGNIVTGGGVTAGSTPLEEWAECLVKAAPLLSALGAPPPLGLSEASPPDAGLVETVLVRDGHALELSDHAGRLERSWWELHR